MRVGRLGTLIVATTLVGGQGAAQDGELIEALTERTFHVCVRGDIGFAAVTAGLKILDLSNPARPRVLSVVSLPQTATCALERGTLVIVAEGPAGVYAVDVSDPSNPSIVSHFDTPGSAMMLDAFRDLVAVADGSMGVALFDFQDPRHPRTLGTDRWPGGYCRGVRFHGDELYACAGRAGVVVLRADRAGEWRIVGGCQTAGDARDIAFHDRTAVVADGKSGLTLLDVSDPADPRTLGTTPVTDLAHGVTIHRGFVYAADGIGGVGVFRLSEPETLESVSRLDTGGGYANKVAVDEGVLFVANDFKGLLVFDIKDPAKPAPVE